MPSQKIREHFMSQFTLVDVYLTEDNDYYAVFKQSGSLMSRPEEFTDTPVGAYVTIAERGEYRAWKKIGEVNAGLVHNKIWRELPQWKADLFGIIAYPLLPDSY